jgi:hypothetical protein
MVTNRRDRIVVFRLSQDEYENLKAVSTRRGARTVSDFARSELLVSMGRGEAEVATLLTELKLRIERVEHLLEDLSDGDRK